MFQQQVQIINTALMALDAFCVILSAYCAYFMRKSFLQKPFGLEGDIFIISILVIIIANNYFMDRFRLYGDQIIKSQIHMVISIAKSVLLSFVTLTAVLFLLQEVDYSRAFLLIFALLTILTLYLERLLAYFYFAKVAVHNYNLHNILIVGSKERGQIVKEVMEQQLSWGHRVIGRLSLEPEACDSSDCFGSIGRLSDVLRQHEVDEVIFALNGDKGFVLSEYLHQCRRMGIRVRILPALWKAGDLGFSIDKCQTVPFITIQSAHISAAGLIYKRLLDILGGLTGTLMLCLIYPFIAIAIKLDSPGPVIFRQKRVGQHGRTFELLKFRSMNENAETRQIELVQHNEMNGNMFKLHNDPRMTRVGRFLRKTSLDEFPQFINVLRSEMSLVGTRPPTPDEVKTYLPDHFKRLTAKPGITGLWQVSGRNEIRDFDRVVQLDCQYLDRWRLSSDVRILFKTLYVVMRRKGAI